MHVVRVVQVFLVVVVMFVVVHGVASVAIVVVMCDVVIVVRVTMVRLYVIRVVVTGMPVIIAACFVLRCQDIHDVGRRDELVPRFHVLAAAEADCAKLEGRSRVYPTMMQAAGKGWYYYGDELVPRV